MEMGHLVLTKKCNMRCRYCYNKVLENASAQNDMDIDVFDKALTLFQQNGIKKLNFTGGEPFKASNIDSFIQNAHSRGFEINATTNAMLLTKDSVKKYYQMGVNSLAISMDSVVANEQEYIRQGSKLKHILEIIEYAQTLNMDISLTAVITNINYKSIGELILFSTRKKIMLSIQPVFDGKSFEERSKLRDICVCDKEWDKFCRVFRIWGKRFNVQTYVETVITYLMTGVVEEQTCNVKNKILVVQPDGIVYPCFFWGQGLGSLINNSIEEIQVKINELRDKDQSCYKNECITCGFRWVE